MGSHQLTEPDRTKVVSYVVGPHTGFKVLDKNNNTSVLIIIIGKHEMDNQWIKDNWM